MANITKTQAKKRAERIAEKLEELQSELDDLAQELEEESESVEPYEGRDELTEQQEEREEMREMRKGNKEYIKNIRFALSRPLFLASAYDLLLFKTWEEIPQQWQHNAKTLKERLEENRDFWLKKGKLETIAQYEKKIKEGFVYSCFTVSSRFPSCEFVACCGVVREEKSPDYKQAERIKEEINKHIYKNNNLSIYEVLELLRFVNISIKRK